MYVHVYYNTVQGRPAQSLDSQFSLTWLEHRANYNILVIRQMTATNSSVAGQIVCLRQLVWVVTMSRHYALLVLLVAAGG